MIIVIDTSAATSTLALLRPSDAGWEGVAEAVFPSGRGEELPSRVGQLVSINELRGVAVATGPGSFTGLRVGVSYGVGLAVGLNLPLYGIGSLELVAARLTTPGLALVEAGREKFYYLTPTGELGHAEVAQLPCKWPAWGLLKESTKSLLVAAGIALVEEGEQLSVSRATAIAMKEAKQYEHNQVSLSYVP